MPEIVTVGEFGSQEWCEACGKAGAKMLEEGEMPPDLVWGFSEIYTQPPARMLTDGRQLSGYHFMVKNGQISGGDGVPSKCLDLPGFHVKARWAAICNQSGTTYGREGQQQRTKEEQAVFADMAKHIGQEDLGLVEYGSKPVWPQPIIDALSVGMEEGGGLHNIAANMQAPSPEFADFPKTQMGVPDFANMTDDQKEQFLKLVGIGK